jgi:pimeloyl-ACP methyl ester carboxylesterase
MNKLIIFFFAVESFSIQLYSQKAKTQPIKDAFVLVDGRKMHYQTAGSGSPTVVFEAGHNSTLRDWSDIFPAIAKMTRVVSHDRLGMGASEESDKPRSYRQISLELHLMLQQANIPPPYILVGHSMGGAVVRAFASQYRKETVGLVMIDPLTENMFKGIPTAEIEKDIQFMDSSLRSSRSTVQKEFHMMVEELRNGAPELNSFDVLDIPTAMLVSTQERPPGWTTGLIDVYKEKFLGLSDCRLIVINQSPHYIQNYEAPTVIESIRRVIYPDAQVMLGKRLKEKGVDTVMAEYKKMRTRYPKDLLPERILNSLGYQALDKNPTGAIKLFSLNASLYPESSNVYDSLGEAYMVAGNKKEAIKNYERSLALNHNNGNAKKMLLKLREATR